MLPPSPKAYKVDAKASENAALVARRQLSSLLWGILHPLLTMSLSESRRQRVLVAVCILYTEVIAASCSSSGNIIPPSKLAFQLESHTLLTLQAGSD